LQSSDKNSDKRDIGLIQRDLILLFERNFSLLWQYGFAVDSLKLAFWLVYLDNCLRFRISDSYPAIYKLLSESDNLEVVAEQICKSEELQFQCIHYIGYCLTNLQQGDKSSEVLEELENQIKELHSQFIHGQHFQNDHPEPTIPADIHLKLRYFNPYHLYRWIQGKRYNEKGTSLSIISEWIHDLEAICALAWEIHSKKLPLRSGRGSFKTLTPIGARKAIAVEDLESLKQCLSVPAKRLRRPAVHNESFLAVLNLILDLDVDGLYQNLERFQELHRLMNYIQKEQYKEHLFLNPFRIGAELLPEPTGVPLELSRVKSIRIVEAMEANRAKGGQGGLSYLLNGLSGAMNLLYSLRPEEIQKRFVDWSHGSKNQLDRLLEQIKGLQASDLQRLFKKSPEEVGLDDLDDPTNSQTNKHTNWGIELADGIPGGSGASGANRNELLKLRQQLVEEKKSTDLKFKFPTNSPLNCFEEGIQKFDEEKVIDQDLLKNTMDGDSWKTNPKGTSNLCRGILLASGQPNLQQLATSDQLDELCTQAATTERKELISELIKTCEHISSNMSPEQMEQINKAIKATPDAREVIHEECCKQEADRIIQQEEWHNLPKKDKLKLSKLANEKHVLEIAEQTIDQFLKQDHLSERDIQRMSFITLRVMDRLIRYLEQQTLDDEHMVLLDKVKLINEHHSDSLTGKIANVDQGFILECQIWLLNICRYIHDKDNQYYLSLVKEVESLFVTVWKKVEEQLSLGVAVQWKSKSQTLSSKA